MRKADNGLASLAGLQSLFSGGNRGGGKSAAQKAPYVDPFDGLEGNDLDNAGRAYLESVMPGDIERRRATQAAIGDPHADINAANDAIMGSETRAPMWSGYFGIMRGKEDAAAASGRGFDADVTPSSLMDTVTPGTAPLGGSPALRALRRVGRG